MTAPWLTPFRDYPYRPQRCVCHLLFLTGSPLDNGYDALREKFPPNEKNFPLLTALKIKTANLSLDQMRRQIARERVRKRVRGARPYHRNDIG